MGITLHLVRHAQGHHNLSKANESLHDPLLTPLGEQQCRDLRAAFPHHDKLTHLVASPLRRTLLTCRNAFGGDGPRATVVAQPLVQEVSAQPCDTGSAPEVLAREFGAWVDGRLVQPGWNDKSPGSRWAPTVGSLEARSREARRWLRALGRGDDDGDAHVVVVTHGGFLHFLTEDWEGMDISRGTGWSNTEWRSYEFVDPQGNDEEASVRETAESWRRRRADAIQLTEAENTQLRAVLIEEMSRAFGETRGADSQQS